VSGINLGIHYTSPTRFQPGVGQPTPIPLTTPGAVQVESMAGGAWWESPVVARRLAPSSSWALFYGGGPIGPVQPAVLSAGGGPVHKINVEIEEQEDRMVLHFWTALGRFLRDPYQFRFGLYAPDTSTTESFWPGSPYIAKLGLGHFAVELIPLQVGRWAYRADCWGPVSAFASGGFTTEITGRHTLRWTVVRTPAVFPVRPIVVML
jgi:hypothetical protein